MHRQKNLIKTDYFMFTQTDPNIYLQFRETSLKVLKQWGEKSVQFWKCLRCFYLTMCLVFFKGQKNVGLLCLCVHMHKWRQGSCGCTNTQRGQRSNYDIPHSSGHTHTWPVFFQHGSFKNNLNWVKHTQAVSFLYWDTAVFMEPVGPQLGCHNQKYKLKDN